MKFKCVELTATNGLPRGFPRASAISVAASIFSLRVLALSVCAVGVSHFV